METKEMGRVVVEARIENLQDLWEVKTGRKTPNQVRSITVPDALIDSGAATLAMPASMIQALGLTKVRERNIRSTTGTARADMYSIIQLTVQGRDCVV